jgi:hypothetical protein
MVHDALGSGATLRGVAGQGHVDQMGRSVGSIRRVDRLASIGSS